MPNAKNPLVTCKHCSQVTSIHCSACTEPVCVKCVTAFLGRNYCKSCAPEGALPIKRWPWSRRKGS
jgi:hypothetical protein